MRVRSLDSLRGVAALVVVASHVVQMIPGSDTAHLSPFEGGVSDPWSWYYGTPLCLLSNGPGAVLIFFALSGVVLSISLDADERYGPFLLRRAIRIWIPFAVATLLSAALAWRFQGQARPDVSGWFNDLWPTRPTVGMIGSHLILSGTDVQLDPVMWSLVHELRISLVFPLIVLLARRWPVASLLGSVALLAPIRLADTSHDVVVQQATQTLSYVFLFIAGAVIGLRFGAAQRLVVRWRPYERRWVWLAAMASMTLSTLANSAPVSTIGCLYLVLSGAGAVLIVALCATQGEVTRHLEARFPMWLGRISYSLYLVHLPVFLGVMRGLPFIPFPLAIPLAFGVSLMVAEVFHRLVERPAILFGRTVSSRGGGVG